MSDVERMSAAEYAPREGLKFIDVFGLHGLYDGMAFNSNLVLVGPKGIGKTLSFQTYAAKVKSPIITFDCSEDVRRSHLIGHHILRGNDSPFILGPLTSAFEIANEVGHCILVLEECLLPTTNVLLPSGQQVQIERLDCGDRVLSFDAQGKQRVSRVARTWVNRHNVVVTMRVDGQLITSSLRHPFLTQRGWLHASDIVAGDRILRVPKVRLTQDGLEIYSSPRTDGARTEPGARSEIPREDVFGQAPREEGKPSTKAGNREVEGAGVSAANDSDASFSATDGLSRIKTKDGGRCSSSDEKVMGRSEGTGETSSWNESVRRFITRRESGSPILAQSEGSRASVPARQRLLERSGISEKDLAEKDCLPAEKPEGEAQVHPLRLVSLPSNFVGAESHDADEGTLTEVHGGRSKMDFDSIRTAPKPGLHCKRETSGTGGRFVLAPSKTTGVRDTSIPQRGISITSAFRSSDSKTTGASAPTGEEVPQWAVVEAVWIEPRVLELRELTLDGPDHTYVANGLGTHNCNALAPQMQKVLNGLADFRRRIEVPECQKVFKLKDGAKLWFVGTMNTAVYGGVYALNEDLKSRFRLLVLDYPNPSQEKAILDGVIDPALMKKLAEDFKKDSERIIDRVIQLAIETRQKSLDYALSPRDVQQLVEDIALIGLSRALRVLIGKFDGEDRSTVKQRIQSIFGISVNEGSIA